MNKISRHRKLYNWLLLSVFILLLSSCASNRLKNNTDRANIRLPHTENEVEKKKKDKKPSVYRFKDAQGKETIYMRTDTNEKGESQLSVDLKEVVVTAKMKNVPERFGKVDIDFIVSVPERLIDKDWQVNLMPVLIKKDKHIPFDDLVLTGADFDKIRMKGYQRYADYLKKIVPDSLFDAHFVKTKAFHKYIDKYNRDEHMRVYKDSLDYLSYKRYISRLNKRYELFNAKMFRSKAWLGEVMGVTEPYQYNKRYEQLVKLIPQFHLFREPTSKTIIKKYRKDKYRYEFENSFRPVTSEDSLFLKKRFYKNRAIAKNEALKANSDLMFIKLVQFPKNLNARLDTIIYNKGKFEYYYHQEIATDEDSKRMQVYMDGFVRTKTGTDYLLPTSDTLSYTVSSMLQFLDRSPRFLRKIIERKVSSSMQAYLTFKVGKSDLELALADNQSEIDKIGEMMTHLTETGEFVMDSISLMAGCSPEGSLKSNELLSKARANSIKKYLLTALTDLDNPEKMLFAKSKGEDWEGLSKAINESQVLKNTQAILELIGKDMHPDTKENEIKRLYPDDYKLMKDSLYPRLRAVDFTFHVHRRGMIQDTIHTTEPDLEYAKAIELLEQRKYREALTILNEYADWNTAICLMSLGYDQGAYTILQNEKESADSEYLLAILASRMGKDEEAVSRYLRACELDHTKKWRGSLDPEINKLIKAFDLHKDDEDDDEY